MKKLILLASIISLNVCAFGPGSGGGGGPVATSLDKLVVQNSKIEAILTKEGIYSRLEDIVEGFEPVKGIEINKDHSIFDIKKQGQLDVSKILLNNGSSIDLSFKVVDGGDMGGGGSRIAK